MKTRSGILEFGSALQRKSVELRRNVLRIPLGLDFTEDELRSESGQFHFAVWDNEKIWAVLILNPDPSQNGCIRMRQVAVDPAIQGQGIGSELVSLSERWAARQGYKIMKLHARLHAVPFYKKLEYETEGKEFMEVGIPHIAMFKTLA